MNRKNKPDTLSFAMHAVDLIILALVVGGMLAMLFVTLGGE